MGLVTSPLDNRPADQGAERAKNIVDRRNAATTISAKNKARPAVSVLSNGDNISYPSKLIAFTKGLAHNEKGFVEPEEYEELVSALTELDSNGMPNSDFRIKTARNNHSLKYSCTDSMGRVSHRKWESPLAGHYFSLEGPDPDGVAMAPAPKLGEDELTAEMAEVYAMALVRDMSFSEINDEEQEMYFCLPGARNKDGSIDDAKKCFYYLDDAKKEKARIKDLLAELSKLNWFKQGDIHSTLLNGKTADKPSKLETRRRKARFEENKQLLTAQSLFRGSSNGVKEGGYISQFLTLGSRGNEEDGTINFGAQTISQKVSAGWVGIDYMTSWAEWLDIQQGVKLGEYGTEEPRLIDSPRDIAEYVHVDQLYQAYFNACLIILSHQGSSDKKNFLQKGFPNNEQMNREGFATFGNPHILSLMTEVASRALKAVRRQKFQIHRRARPERLAAMLTLAANGEIDHLLSSEQKALNSMANNLGMFNGTKNTPTNFAKWITELNKHQNSHDIVKRRRHTCSPKKGLPKIAISKNYLLPMAFPEGSPMHPAYGAGHATVAGACVTVLKAFFAMTDEDDSLRSMELLGGDKDLTIEGELNKLAANIAIGRNFAGVHFYTDYYDSLRMGERVAIGILQEQMLNYTEAVSMKLNGFDGEAIQIETNGSSSANGVKISIDGNSSDGVVAEWWTKNVSEFPIVGSDAKLVDAAVKHA